MLSHQFLLKLYQNNLSDIKQLLLPPSPEDNSDYFDVYQNYEIEADNRDELKDYLKDNGIGTLIQWNGQPVHSIVALGFKGSGLPYTEEMYTKCLMLPMNLFISDEDIKYISQKIIEFYSYV